MAVKTTEQQNHSYCISNNVDKLQRLVRVALVTLRNIAYHLEEGEVSVEDVVEVDLRVVPGVV